MSAHVLFYLLNKLRKRDKNAKLVKNFIAFSQFFIGQTIIGTSIFYSWKFSRVSH